MGIANSTVIKKGIDLLTAFITHLNKLLDTVESIGGSVSKSLVSMGLFFATLYAGGKILYKVS